MVYQYKIFPLVHLYPRKGCLKHTWPSIHSPNYWRYLHRVHFDFFYFPVINLLMTHRVHFSFVFFSRDHSPMILMLNLRASENRCWILVIFRSNTLFLSIIDGPLCWIIVFLILREQSQMLFWMNSSIIDYIPYALKRMARQPPWPSCSGSFGFLVLCNQPYENCRLAVICILLCSHMSLQWSASSFVDFIQYIIPDQFTK